MPFITSKTAYQILLKSLVRPATAQSSKMIILGIWDDDKPDKILINHMILLFKRYIYLKKEDQNGLSLRGLTAFFIMIEIIERRIAQERDKLNFHYRKWDPILPLL